MPRGVDVPMIAAAATDFGSGMKAHYIFAYTRATNNTVVIDPFRIWDRRGESVLVRRSGREGGFY